MASIQLDHLSRQYRISFRYGTRQFKRSLKTAQKREANAALARVEETIRLLERGIMDLSSDAEPGMFILSGGKRNGKTVIECHLTLKELFVVYQNNIPQGVKEESTLKCERYHMNHLSRHLGSAVVVQSLNTDDLQRYVHKRSCDHWHGKLFSPETIKKELTTFRLIWSLAENNGHLSGNCPVKGIKLAKQDEKLPFMTWEEIERIIFRGGLTEEEERGLWGTLFLVRPQIDQIIAEINKVALQPFIYPMFVFVAHTGARRSELLRSEIDGFDFSSRLVRIREKKRSRSKALTFRSVPMTNLLYQTMKDWFRNHPGGKYTITQESKTVRSKTCELFSSVTPDEATHHFKRTIRATKWNHIKGFHVFRHSFASNAAAVGVDHRFTNAKIKAWRLPGILFSITTDQTRMKRKDVTRRLG